MKSAKRLLSTCLAKSASARALVSLAAGAGVMVMLPGAAKASENGTSFYLLGSGGPGAAVTPPFEGIYFDNTLYYYSASPQVTREFVIGGQVVVGVDAEVLVDMPAVIWVPSTDLLGGTLALAAAVPVGNMDIDVDAILTGPSGQQTARSIDDDATIVMDPVATAVLGWRMPDNVHASLSAMVNIPIGHYREGELANLSFHRWIVDVSSAVTWHDPEAGWDVSGKAGITFNGTNDYTDYDTGTELHAEASVERMFSPAFSAGLQAYHFQQLSGDSGAGAVLGPFKGEVTAVGVTAAAHFRIGSRPVIARFRLFEEFDSSNRLEGTAAFFSLTMPLSMRIPHRTPEGATPAGH